MQFVVLNHSRPEIFEGERLASCVAYWTGQTDSVRILGAGCGLKGFVSLVEVESEAARQALLDASPVSDIEDVRWYPVAPLAGSEVAVVDGEHLFLVIATARTPRPADVDMPAAAAHWRNAAGSGRAEVFRILPDDGFVVVLRVSDNEELMRVMMANPVNRWGEFEVIPLIDSAAEARILSAAGIL